MTAILLKYEAPTWVLAIAIYGCWFTLVWFHADLPWWLLLPVGAYVTAIHFSLQHEAIHSWRSLPAWLRTAIVWPPIGLWNPFEAYRNSHSIHHRNANLTYPGLDTESVYHRLADWQRYPAIWRRLLMVNQTFPGRLLLGPPIRLSKVVTRDWARLARGDFSNGWVWLRHVIGIGAILLFVTEVAGMPLWQYLLFFFYGGMVLGWIRPFLEHRWGETPYQRVAAIEAHWLFGLLFLWNNLHIVHHRYPTMPWYEIPGFYRRNRAAMLALNGGYVYAGYADVWKRFWRKPTFVPVHPDSPTP